jgi:hypothetical protein
MNSKLKAKTRFAAESLPPQNVSIFNDQYTRLISPIQWSALLQKVGQDAIAVGVKYGDWKARADGSAILQRSELLFRGEK